MRPASSTTRAVPVFLLCSIALPAMAASLQAQGAVIEGRVTAEGGPALPGANVYVLELNASVGTDSGGRYRISLPASRVQGQTVHVRVRSVGYSPQQRELRLDAGTHTINFTLRADVTRLSEVVVTGVAMAPEQIRMGFAVTRAPQDPQFRRGSRWNTEEYAKRDDNPFLTARSAPLSTFSIDVDRASYTNVRRFLVTQNMLPPADAVRIEELVNYFPYDYAEPRGNDPVAISTEVAQAPWAPEHLLVRVGLQTQRVDFGELPPSNLVFLIDVSGSMYGPKRLPLVKQSLRMLVQELRPQDRVALVVYAGAAGLVLPSTAASEKERILQAISALEAGGSTAGGAGIRLAYDVARASHLAGGNNRVILATDGDFNIGVSNTAELSRLVEDRRKQGTYLTVLGFGMGNLKDSRLEELAAHGNGNYAYIDDLLEARKVLVHEMGGTLVTVANDVKIQVEFNPRAVSGYRLIGYENRLLAAEDFENDEKDAGEIGAGHSVTALYEVIPVGARSTVRPADTPRLRYQSERRQAGGAASAELLTVSVRYKRPGESQSLLLSHPVARTAGAQSPDFTFATAVAAFGMLLRDSPHRGSFSYAAVRELAAGALGNDPHGYRAGFLELVDAAERLSGVVAVRER